MDNDEQAIRALISTWMEASAAGDSARVLELMTEDVVFLGAGRPPMTKADFAAASRTMEGQRVEGTAEIQEIRIFGAWAYCWNQLNVTIHPSGEGHTRHLRGPALSVLRKAADGSWAIARDANMVTAQPVRETDTAVKLSQPVPILRILDEPKAREFYVEFLGFSIDWKHRFGADAPLYMQVSRTGCVVHLSEHYGDCTPGGAVRIETSDVDKLNRELLEKKYKYARPGVEETPWRTREMSIKDPFGNRIIFYQPLGRPV
jgi:uncharacterized protein (TIGR02246 family)